MMNSKLLESSREPVEKGKDTSESVSSWKMVIIGSSEVTCNCLKGQDISISYCSVFLGF